MNLEIANHTRPHIRTVYRSRGNGLLLVVIGYLA